ncbi:hypothetical protein LWI28_025579 [Acer negundo]|uniref:RNase H type-1 domain-containing protein n=1 Tax=Acer negundo TaxID=4023 RepID=A0AAD5J804_ACENE|nr:hypothetical protein LWI28_025579 [Acer negundo]
MEFNVNLDPVTKLDPSPDLTDLDIWVLFTDGASSQSGCEAGIIVINPKGVKCSHCFRFKFRATNNKAEYEALLAGMRVAEALGADFLLVKSDSQLVVNHVLGLYKAKGDNMVVYLAKVREAMMKDGIGTPKEKSPGRCSGQDRSR